MALTKILLSLLFVSSMVSGSPYDEDHPPTPAKYRFAWAVKDEPSLNDYAQEEERDGDFTKGSYRMALADGRLQVVDYYVNKDSGFVAGVTYSGEATSGIVHKGDSSSALKTYQETSHLSPYDVREHKNNQVIDLHRKPVDYVDVGAHQHSKYPNKPESEILRIDRPAYQPDNSHPTSQSYQWYPSKIQSGENGISGRRYIPQETVPETTGSTQDRSGDKPHPSNLKNAKETPKEVKQDIVEKEVPLTPAVVEETSEDKLAPEVYSGVLWREEYMRRMNQRLAGKQRGSFQADDSTDKEQPKLKPAELKSSQSATGGRVPFHRDSVQPKPGTQRKPFQSDYVSPV